MFNSLLRQWATIWFAAALAALCLRLLAASTCSAVVEPVRSRNVQAGCFSLTVAVKVIADIKLITCVLLSPSHATAAGFTPAEGRRSWRHFMHPARSAQQSLARFVNLK
jgi:hypothetical protein